MADIIKMTQIDYPNFRFDFEDELNAFDINQQPDYQYNVNADTSNFPTLVEFFSQENINELIRKAEDCLKDKNFDGTTKDERREEKKKWFRKDTERKFKRPLKFYKRDSDVSLGGYY
ncbi:hypothetical protein Hanom_Chr03g00209321 [Helianthus anomalus]